MATKNNHVTKPQKKEFLDALRSATVEKDIEVAYRRIFEQYYGGKFSAIHGTDGYLEPDKSTLLASTETSLRLLLEAKWQKKHKEFNPRLQIQKTFLFHYPPIRNRHE